MFFMCSLRQNTLGIPNLFLKKEEKPLKNKKKNEYNFWHILFE